MKRRAFIAALGGVAVWPLAARTQQSGKLPTIGFLGAATHQAVSHWVVAFERRLRELGWSEGRTITIEYRWAEGRSDRFGEIAAELVRLKVTSSLTQLHQHLLQSRQRRLFRSFSPRQEIRLEPV
jgi:putative tryptophan/tyrosine transport system substrate-binding protein